MENNISQQYKTPLCIALKLLGPNAVDGHSIPAKLTKDSNTDWSMEEVSEGKKERNRREINSAPQDVFNLHRLLAKKKKEQHGKIKKLKNKHIDNSQQNNKKGKVPEVKEKSFARMDPEGECSHRDEDKREKTEDQPQTDKEKKESTTSEIMASVLDGENGPPDLEYNENGDNDEDKCQREAEKEHEEDDFEVSQLLW